MIDSTPLFHDQHSHAAIGSSLTPSMSAKAREFGFDVGPVVIDIIEDKDTPRRKEIANGVSLFTQVSCIVVAVQHRKIEAPRTKRAEVGERVLAGLLRGVRDNRIVPPELDAIVAHRLFARIGDRDYRVLLQTEMIEDGNGVVLRSLDAAVRQVRIDRDHD